MVGRVSIAAPSFDVLGYAPPFKVVPGESTIENITRRGSKTATLDGGAYIEDLGYTDADRDFDLRMLSPSVEVVATIKYLLRTYAFLVLSCAEGCFLGSVTGVVVGSDVRVLFKVSTRLSAEP